jgi:hypothetical protein
VAGRRLLHGRGRRAVTTVDVESARRDWADGWRRLQEESREPAAADRLGEQLGVVTDELRRRVGSTFTLAELAEVYADADRWARAAVAEEAAAPDWPRLLSVVQDAAFHLYARGAVDYKP